MQIEIKIRESFIYKSNYSPMVLYQTFAKSAIFRKEISFIMLSKEYSVWVWVCVEMKVNVTDPTHAMQ